MQALLISTATAARFDPNGALFRSQYAGEWNVEEQRWQAPEGFVPVLRRSIAVFLGGAPWKPPGPARFAQDMRNSLLFSPVGRSQMLRIAIRTPRPQLAVDLLSNLHREADRIIRDQERRRVTAYLDYLNRELPKVANTENRTAMTDLIVEQQRQLMMLSAENVSFASEIVEPPSIPYRPIGPGGLMVLIMFTAVGLGAGLAAILYLPAELLTLRATWKNTD
jgi:uncharacterized protein involved in exopolysaccharide biosynthesis